MFQPDFALTVNHARTAYEAGLAAISAGETEFDLAQVSAVDSAAVATLLSWRNAARKAGVVLHFNHFPPTLRTLIDLYGVTDLLQARS